MKKIITVAISLFLSPTFMIANAAGDISAGKVKSATCASCHGKDGNSIAPIFPVLAGQYPAYLSKQLLDFKNKSRKNTSMEAFASPLSKRDIENLSAYYASKKVKLPKKAKNKEQYLDEDEEIMITEELIAAGKSIYHFGNVASSVPACSACHGANADGNLPAGFANLKGQHAAYLSKSLSDFKSGERNNDASAMMQTIAKQMSEDEIYAVAAYIASIR